MVKSRLWQLRKSQEPINGVITPFMSSCFLVRLAAHVSNGLKSRIRPVVGRIRLQHKPKSNNYTKSCMINEADIWRGRNVWYLGRSVWYASKEVTIVQSNAEHTEVSRGHSSRETKYRINRSLKYDWEMMERKSILTKYLYMIIIMFIII